MSKESQIPEIIIQHLENLPSNEQNLNRLINMYENGFLEAQNLPDPQRKQVETNLFIGALLQSNTGH